MLISVISSADQSSRPCMHPTQPPPPKSHGSCKKSTRSHVPVPYSAGSALAGAAATASLGGGGSDDGSSAGGGAGSSAKGGGGFSAEGGDGCSAVSGEGGPTVFCAGVDANDFLNKMGMDSDALLSASIAEAGIRWPSPRMSSIRTCQDKRCDGEVLHQTHKTIPAPQLKARPAPEKGIS